MSYGALPPSSGTGLAADTSALPHSVTTPLSGPGRLVRPITTKSPPAFITSLGGYAGPWVVTLSSYVADVVTAAPAGRRGCRAPTR